MATYRPSAQVRLQLRAEEFGDFLPLESRLEKPTESGEQVVSPSSRGEIRERLRENQKALRQIASQKDTRGPTAYAAERNRLLRERTKLQNALQGLDRPQSAPLTVAGDSPDGNVLLGGILPQSVTLERNGLREADTCTITINHSDAPIDARVVRSCLVEVIVGVVDPSDFERGMTGARDESGVPYSVVQRGIGSGLLAPATRFIGWVDSWDSQSGGRGGDEVTLECRDLTSVLIDQEFNAARGINLDRPIVKGVQELIDRFPALQGMKVYLGSFGTDNGAGRTPSDSIPRTKKARRGKSAKRHKRGDQSMSVWDHIVDTCNQLELVPLVDGLELRLIDPSELYRRNDNMRIMVYGRNLDDLSFSRKLGRIKAPTIEVRSFDSSRGRTLWARYPVKKGQKASGVFGKDKPPKPLRANEPGVSGAAPSEKIWTIHRSGISDQKALERIARSTFDQMARQEIEGRLKTADIDSFARRGNEIVRQDGVGDLLEARPGDAIELLVASAPKDGEPPPPLGRGATFQQIVSLTRQARADYLVGIGWDRKVADRLAALQDEVGFQTIFRVQNVRVTFKAESGLELDMDFINFITIREEGGTEEQSTRRQEASAAVSSTVGGRTGREATNLRKASEDRRTLTQQRAEGLISPAEYNRRISVLIDAEKVAQGSYRDS